MLLKKILKIVFIFILVATQSVCAGEKPNILESILAEDISSFKHALKNTDNPTFFTDKLGTKHNLLSAAVYSKNVEFLQQLIAAGADVNAENLVGETAIYDAIIACNIPSAKLLLKHGIKADHKNKMGLTPLHGVALSQCKDVVKLLVQYGANKATKNQQGLTAYELAIKMNNTLMAEQLK